MAKRSCDELVDVEKDRVCITIDVKDIVPSATVVIKELLNPQVHVVKIILNSTAWSGVDISQDQSTVFSCILQFIEAPIHLKFIGINFHGMLSRCLSVLKRSAHVVAIEFFNSELTLYDAKFLDDFVLHLPAIKKFSYCEEDRTLKIPDKFGMISSHLPHCTSIERLYIEVTEMPQSTLDAVGTMLMFNRNLRKIKVHSLKVKKVTNCRLICEALKVNTTLKRISIHASGSLDILAALQKNTGLTFLRLDVDPLAESLPFMDLNLGELLLANSTIRTIDLHISANHLDDPNIQRALVENTTLKKLRIDRGKNTNVSMTEILKGVMVNSNLDLFSMYSKPHILVPSCEEFMQTLNKNHTIRQFYVGYIQTTPEDDAYIRNAFQQHPTIVASSIETNHGSVSYTSRYSRMKYSYFETLLFDVFLKYLYPPKTHYKAEVVAHTSILEPIARKDTYTYKKHAKYDIS